MICSGGQKEAWEPAYSISISIKCVRSGLCAHKVTFVILSIYRNNYLVCFPFVVVVIIFLLLLLVVVVVLYDLEIIIINYYYYKNNNKKNKNIFE